MSDLTITDFVGEAWWFIGGVLLLGFIVQTVQQRRARMEGGRSRAISDLATGAVLGSATGDALGAGYEFTNPAPDQEIAMIGGGGFGWAPGSGPTPRRWPSRSSM